MLTLITHFKRHIQKVFSVIPGTLAEQTTNKGGIMALHVIRRAKQSDGLIKFTKSDAASNLLVQFVLTHNCNSLTEVSNAG